MDISDFKSEYSIPDLGITPAVISKVMGYSHNDAPEPVLALITDVISQISCFTDVRAEYKIVDDIVFDDSTRTIKVSGITFYLKNIIYSQIKHSSEVALFICTAGNSIEAKTGNAKREKDLLLEYVYDVIGSEIAEVAASKLEAHLRKVKKNEGKNVSMRFSPGYCGWEVNEQKMLFKFFPDNYCHIALTESSFMTPVKSVSGIMGIGSYSFKTNYQCSICKDQNCIYRNRKIRG
jgi:hypothetical protein